MKLFELRQAFLDFFEAKGHFVKPSAPLIPQNDPSLMFINAGMVPFKNVFSGQETLRSATGDIITTATSSQKCVRAGGKHNDLDNVGYTSRHHTFFEMLGNFSFGDYFKEEAISHAWEFLTKILKLPEDKLYITVYHTDDEAFDLWKKITGFPDKKILRVPTNDNFWSMGSTGPCGPCSEIFYDHGEAFSGEWALDESGADLFDTRYVEIWNLVFMQFNIAEEGAEMKPLPKPCIDTGMGLERMSAIMEGVHDNYDISLFKNLIAASIHESGNDSPEMHTSHRVIADHLRSTGFLIADGVRPSNEGRGYVLRRIMRRAMRHAHLLGCQKPLMHRLVPHLVHEMGDAFPELIQQQALISDVLKAEEIKFKETLERGLKLLEEEISGLATGHKFSGKTAFKLYDTYGFPLDLTEDILRGKNIQIDLDGFEHAMEEQKKRARAAWAGSGDTKESAIWFDLQEQFGSTEFLGYQTLQNIGLVQAIIQDNAPVDQANAGQTVWVLCNQTPFYGESGGQSGDHGTAYNDNVELTITNCQKPLGSLIIHQAKITKGSLAVGDSIQLSVDEHRRNALQANHSATHLLHAALKKMLGDHITQKGSLVEAAYLRFDFSHDCSLSDAELSSVEDMVNAVVLQNAAVHTRVMAIDDAKSEGAAALFGEKYGDEVRVVDMGTDDLKHFSIELCGGTHVARTGDIGTFRITRESAVSSGVRRIEAITRDASLQAIRTDRDQIHQIAALLKSAPGEAGERIKNLLEERKRLEKQLSDAQRKLALGDGRSSDDSNAIETIHNVAFVGKLLNGTSPKDLRGIVDSYKQKIGTGVIALIAINDDKASIVVGVTDDISAKHSAVDLVRIGSSCLGGKGGGGRPDFAQAGGTEIDQADAAISAIKEKLTTDAA